MSAIYRSKGDMLMIFPSVRINAGDVVSLGGVVGVAYTNINANESGYIQTRGEYEIDVTPGTEYAVGDYVPVTAKGIDGTETTVLFGPALVPVASTDDRARVLLKSIRGNVTDSTGGSAGTAIVAPAGSSYTAEELKTNFATIAAALNS